MAWPASVVSGVLSPYFSPIKLGCSCQIIADHLLASGCPVFYILRVAGQESAGAPVSPRTRKQAYEVM
jgi:hypothetical protein